MLGLFKDRGKKISFIADHVEGLKLFEEQERLNVTWDFGGNKLTFESIVNKKKSKIHLDLEKVIDAGIATEQEITEKDKNVIGRAAVGTLLLGPLGGIVGGMSGVGSKKKSKDLRVAVINYESGQVVLLGNKFSLGMDGFFRRLNKYINENSSKEDIEL